ncbi:hypothetical protein N9H36_00485 [Planktomarina temperata]|nr:hypothetical protein [Planktomarina temperata]
MRRAAPRLTLGGSIANAENICYYLNMINQNFIAVLLVIAALYGLWRGFAGFWKDAEGQRTPAVLLLVLSPVLIFVGIKIIDAEVLPIWAVIIILFGLFWSAMWIGRILFPKSNTFGDPDKK